MTGTAEDFCLLVTQRRHRDDLSLVADRRRRRRWLDARAVLRRARPDRGGPRR